MAASTAWEGGLASSLPEATASSCTFAGQAAGLGLAWAGPEPHNHTQTQHHCDVRRWCEPEDSRGRRGPSSGAIHLAV